ncbi:MAG: hypothetical protein QOE08_1091 [Thermoleophilaceae bacterium]|jgi:hypothetical protein|nr:hypothetical protein [Thermoleophilaceae bacterium]
MKRRLTALSTLALWLLLAVPAFAHDNGEGLAGETDDKVVTFFCLGVLLFFVAVVIVGSAIQGALEKRKDAKKAAHMRGQVGW